MIENSLVYGGTSSLTNRAIEMGHQLIEVDSGIVDEITTKIKQCDSIESLISVLQYMEEQNINFVGSRGYVYMTKSMICMLETGFYSFNLFTRSCGLRDKVVELIRGHDDEYEV